jgi:hypothetical protein
MSIDPKEIAELRARCATEQEAGWQTCASIRIDTLLALLDEVERMRDQRDAALDMSASEADYHRLVKGERDAERAAASALRLENEELREKVRAFEEQGSVKIESLLVPQDVVMDAVRDPRRQRKAKTLAGDWPMHADLLPDEEVDPAVYVARVAIDAFNEADQESLTSHQRSRAALEFLRTIRNIKGPFAVFGAENMLWPQYGTPSDFAFKMEEKWTPWAAEQASRLLSMYKPSDMPLTWRHWQKLAKAKK